MNLRKFGALFLALVLTLSLCAVPAAAAGSDFEIKDGVLTKYTGSGGAVTIPNGVTKIGDKAFLECLGLASVTIPNGVTEIGNYAFFGCTGLASVTIDDGVTIIGADAFVDTPWLKSLGEFATINHIFVKYQGPGGAVTIPKGVTSIGERAFIGCLQLKSVTIPDSVTSIGGEAFFCCTELESITIPGSVTTIGEGAFSGCPQLISITIPNSGTTISEHALNDLLDIITYGGAGNAVRRYAKENNIGDQTVPIAIAAPQTVLVDGKEVKFDAFALKDENGNMTNYFKVRDIAMALNGTAAQFAVEWANVVLLKTGKAYTPNGTEMTSPFSGNQPYALGENLGVSVNGGFFSMDYIVLTDAKGNGYTYYMLRDLGEQLGFKVDWNGKNVTIDASVALPVFGS